LPDHILLPAEQRQRADNRDGRNEDAVARRAGTFARRQLLNRMHRQSDRRSGDQHDLKHGRQRLGLAMAKAVVVIGGHPRNPHPRQRGHTGHQIQPVSARLPSIAVEPVLHAAQPFSPTSSRPW
jgi:hypothetical protein